MRNKRGEIQGVIVESIEESKKKDGSDDPHHTHPAIEIMANYDFSAGVAKAGMSWGVVGHAIKHAADSHLDHLAVESRRTAFKRSNTVGF